MGSIFTWGNEIFNIFHFLDLITRQTFTSWRGTIRRRRMGTEFPVRLTTACQGSRSTGDAIAAVGITSSSNIVLVNFSGTEYPLPYPSGVAVKGRANSINLTSKKMLSQCLTTSFPMPAICGILDFFLHPEVKKKRLVPRSTNKIKLPKSTQ